MTTIHWTLTAGRLAHAFGHVFFPAAANEAARVATTPDPLQQDEHETDDVGDLETPSPAGAPEGPLVAAPTHVHVQLLTGRGPVVTRYHVPQEDVDTPITERRFTARHACHMTLGTSHVCCPGHALAG